MKPVETLILHDFGIFLSILCLGSLLRITVSVQIGQSQELVGGFTPLGKHKGICTYMYYIYIYVYVWESHWGSESIILPGGIGKSPLEYGSNFGSRFQGWWILKTAKICGLMDLNFWPITNHMLGITSQFRLNVPTTSCGSIMDLMQLRATAAGKPWTTHP